jgi:hypothetical protein
MWAGIGLLAARMFATDPPTAGFDLELLLAAGRDVAAGRSPYDPAIVAGAAPAGTQLFYSYPPLVAQAMSLLAGLPAGAVFAAWSVTAVAGVGIAAFLLRRALGVRLESGLAIAGAVAASAVVLPFAIGILFGNVDAFFPLLYGLLLAGCLAWGRPAQLVGGAAIAVAALVKVHPASIGIWLVARLVRARREGRSWPVNGVVVGSAVAGAALLGLSLIAGGLAPWLEYAKVAGVIGGSDLLDPRNAGLAAQVALLAGGDNGLVRMLQLPVAVGAAAVSAWSAWSRDDVVESLAWGAAASLVVLPVTWYHYPAALLPFGIAAMLRAHETATAPRTAALLAGACAVAAAALLWLPLLWVAVALVIAATRASWPEAARR